MRMTIFYFLGTNPILSEMRFTAAPDCAAIANRAPFNPSPISPRYKASAAPSYPSFEGRPLQHT